MTHFFKYTAYMIVLLLIFAASTQADDRLTSQSGCENELQQTRRERDSAFALLKLYGVKPFKYRVILKTNYSYEPYLGYRNLSGISFDTKLTINLNTVVSPYIGGTLGVIGYGFAHISANVGVEKAFIYNNGFSITPSLGIHTGGIGTGGSKPYNLVGAHSTAEFAFSHKRFSPYLLTGMRYSYIFYVGNIVSFPFLGAGLSLKI
jgi:hypothetical protein